MIASDYFMPVGRDAVVKGAGSHVQHPVILCTVLENDIIGRRLCEKLLLIGGGDKVGIIQVALIHSPHVSQAEEQDGSYHPFCL
ncbi:hypothetical protein SDC9_203415 [bioreactor metagenome]|uniref:Uncharacterized protein n=1 Tax=bioreactor metagenome TaxID=1076179 RepID=A0A645IWM0_9ZZZZ